MSTQVQETITCTTCGAEATLHYGGETGIRMRTEQVCFLCAYWTELIAKDAQNPERAVVVEGVHYTIAPDLKPGTPKHCAGFGGTKYVIQFKDGRLVTSRNLWYQGPIPDRWRGQLPDNAVFEAS
jgi:hypothetical protein